MKPPVAPIRPTRPSSTGFRTCESSRRACHPTIFLSEHSLHSRNPHGTAVFSSVPRNQIFPSAFHSQQVRDQKSEIQQSLLFRRKYLQRPTPTTKAQSKTPARTHHWHDQELNSSISLLRSFRSLLLKLFRVNFTPPSHPVPHSALPTSHSRNPHGTAVFCSVPRNQIFFKAPKMRHFVSLQIRRLPPLLPALCSLCLPLGALCVTLLPLAVTRAPLISSYNRYRELIQHCL